MDPTFSTGLVIVGKVLSGRTKAAIVFFRLLMFFLPLIAWPAFSQFSQNFNATTLDQLRDVGWEFNAITRSTDTPIEGSHSLLTSNLSTTAAVYVTSGYWYDNLSGDRTLSIQYRANWNGTDERRGEFRVRVFGLTSGFRGQTSWIISSTSGTTDAVNVLISPLVLGEVGWFYFVIEAKRFGSNTGGTSVLRFDNFGGNIPNNSEFPNLSPEVDVTPTLTVASSSIGINETTTATFTFTYEASRTGIEVRNKQYQFTLPPEIEYVSHTLSGPGSSNFNPGNNTISLNLTEPNPSNAVSLVLTLRGIEDCPNCEISFQKNNQLQPNSGITGNALPLSVLPVELIFFDAQADLVNKQVKLSWATASEKDNDFFSIERSANGRVFYPIGTVQGAGDHVGRLDYSFSDVSPLQGISYYRLKQTDFDGTYSYSSVVRIILPAGNTEAVVFPNPAQSSQDVNIMLKGEWPKGRGQISVYNMSGQLISTMQLEENQIQQNQITFPNQLKPGVYILQLQVGHKGYRQKLSIVN